jgi:hypothetical protein
MLAGLKDRKGDPWNKSNSSAAGSQFYLSLHPGSTSCKLPVTKGPIFPKAKTRILESRPKLLRFYMPDLVIYCYTT